jgi:CMP-N-acetylneuraminic acid synthetase
MISICIHPLLNSGSFQQIKIDSDSIKNENVCCLVSPDLNPFCLFSSAASFYQIKIDSDSMKNKNEKDFMKK